MSNTASDLHSRLLRLSEPIAEILRRTQYTPEESSKVSTKDVLLSLLPNTSSHSHASIKNLALACALLSSSRSSTHELLSWIPENLSAAGESTFCEASRDYFSDFPDNDAEKLEEPVVVDSEKARLVIELLPMVLPELKESIEGSSIGKSNDGEDVSASMERKPVGYAILAAHQLSWFVTQVEKPNLAKCCNLVVPCALTALDHWSPQVKGQGMISLVHLAKNVSSGDLGLYGDVVLDACCQNIASDDEIWIHVVELSVLLVTKIHQNNPRSSWHERIMNEMLGHLERQPRNKERRIAWLRFIEPLLDALGLFLLAHFRRIFPLFFQPSFKANSLAIFIASSLKNALHNIHIQDIRLKSNPISCDSMWTKLATVEYVTFSRLNSIYLDIEVFRFKVLANAIDCASTANSHHEDIDIPKRIFPNLSSIIMNLSVCWISKLLQHMSIRSILKEVISFLNSSTHSFG